MITLGIYPDMALESYHRGVGKDALGSTGIKALRRSAAHLTVPQGDPTPAMIFGQQFHCAALERYFFDVKYVVPPEIKGTSKKAKAETIIWQGALEYRGQEEITQESLGHINNMVDSLYNSRKAVALLSNGVAEQSIFWKDPDYGFLCKCRPDWRNEKVKALVDLKTTQDASPGPFGRQVVNLGYVIQAAWYLRGVREMIDPEYNDFVLVAIEKTPPYDVGIYRLKPEDIALADAKIDSLLPRYAEALETQRYAGLPDQVLDLDLPGFFYNNI